MTGFHTPRLVSLIERGISRSGVISPGEGGRGGDVVDFSDLFWMCNLILCEAGSLAEGTAFWVGPDFDYERERTLRFSNIS